MMPFDSLDAERLLLSDVLVGGSGSGRLPRLKGSVTQDRHASHPRLFVLKPTGQL